MKTLFLKTNSLKNITPQIILCLLFFLGIILQTNAFLSSNDLWLMIAAKRWLAGGNYYHDFVENNPPLILFLSAIPVYIAKTFSLSLSNAFFLFVFFMSVVSLYFSNHFLKKILIPDDAKLISTLTIGIGFVYWIAPGFSFGEREHLMLILIMPYLLCAALRCDQKSISAYGAVVIGFFAALGFGLKPYFLLTLLFVEIYVLLQSKNRAFYFIRPELITLCVTLLLYVAAIFFLTPTYMTHILPMVLQFYLGFEKESWASMLFEREYFILVIALLFPIIFFDKTEYKKSLFVIFYLSLLGLIAAFLMQRKLWYYHMYPAFSCAFLLMIYYVALLKNRSWDFLKKVCAFTLILLSMMSFSGVIVPNSLSSVYKKHNSDSSYVKMQKAIAYYRREGKVYFFTTELGDLTPLANHFVDLSPRFPAFWMLPGMLHCLDKGPNASCYASAVRLKQYLLNAVLEDFIRYRPTVVVVHTQKYQPYLYEPPYLTITHFSFIDFFSENPQFKQIWARYHLVEKIKHEEIFVLQ